MSNIGISIGAENRELLSTLSSSEAALRRFAQSSSSSMQGFSQAARQSEDAVTRLYQGMQTAFIGGGIAAGLITLQNGIQGVTQALVEAQTSSDKLTNTLSFALGAENAVQEVAYLKAMTQELGVSYGATTQMYARFAASTKDTVLQGQQTREIFEAVAQASVVMGLSVEESEGMFRALTQMVSKGVIQAEELRGQLGERLPGAFKVFADSMGKSTAELSKMLEAGQVGPENLAGFASFLKSSVAPQVESATQSMQANINRLGNEWLWFKQAVVNSGVGAAMSDALGGATTALGGARAGIEAATDSGAAMRTVFDAAGIAAVALGGSIASRVVTALRDKAAAASADRAAMLASAQASATEAQASATSTAAKLADLRATEASIAATRQQAIEEMKAAAAAAQSAQSLNARQSALVRYTAAQMELNATASRQQAVHGELSQALAQHQTAMQNASTATNTLVTAQNAASVSGRAMGAVMGALGGPVGIAITAVSMLAIELLNLKAAANDASMAGLSRERLVTASQNGVQAEAEDISRVRVALQGLKRERDQLLVDQKDGGLMGALFGADYQSGNANKLAKVNGDIVANERVLKQYEDATNGVAGAIVNADAAQRAAQEGFRRAIEGTRTAATINDDYTKKLDAARKALQTFLGTQASATDKQDAQRRFDEYQVELTKGRDAALKSLNKTTSNASAASRDYARAVDSELASLQAKVQTEAQYAVQLAQHGLAAARLTEGEKEAAKIGYELALAFDAKAQATTKEGRAKIDARIATLQLHQAEAQRLADFQLQNKATKDALELGQKAIDDLQKQADAIRDKTAALAEENAAYGQINPTLAKALAQGKELAGQMVMTDGSVMDYERAQRAAEAWSLMNGYIGQLMQQDWNKINGAVQEWQRSATEQAKLYEDEARLSGLSALERAKVVAARQVELKLAKQIAEIERTQFSEDPVKDAAQKAQLIADATTAAQTESSAAVAKVVQEDWTRTSEKIEEVLIDALMDGGKSGAEYIEGLFRSMVLRPELQAIVSPVAGAVTSALGLPGGSAAGGGLMGLANTASGLNNLYNMGASAANWLGLGTATATGLGLSAAMGTGTALAATGTGLGLSAGLGAGYGFAAGGGLGLTAASAGAGTIGAGLGTSAAVTGAGAAATGGAMSTLGAAMPWIGGALIVDQLFGGKISSSIGKILGIGGDDKPRYRYQTGGGDFEDKVSVAGVYGNIGMHDNGSKNIKAADFTETFQAIADLDATIAATLSPDQNAQIKTALDNYVSGKNESTADYVADRMRIMADVIGGGVNELVDQFGGTSEELVGYLLRLTQAQPTIDALAFLGKSLGDTEAATLSAALAMENLVGGQQNLLALTGSFYQNFYTEAERTAHAAQALTDAMTAIGVYTLPATREAFRDLVEAQDLTTESGRETAAGLLGLHGAFAALVPTTDELTESLAETQTAIKDVFQELRDAIQGARDDVQSALDTINGPKTLRDFGQLTTAVNAVDVTAPSSASVTTAKSALEQARSKPQYLVGAESYAEYWANLQAGTQTAFESAQQRAAQTQGVVDARWQDVWNWSGGDRGSWQTYRDQINAGTWWERDSDFSGAYGTSFQDWYNETTRLQGIANEAGLARTNAISANDVALTQKSEAQASANTANAEWQSSITAAQNALTTAENDYFNSLAGWIGTAKVSVETLGALKDETLAYYEAQQQLADGMRQSAANLRAAAQEAMRQTLSTDTALGLRLADFDRAYTLALSTSGADKAGYADQMAAALPQLAQDIAAQSSSRVDWQVAVAKLANQSSTVASQLEAQAPENLQAEANRVLGLIDGKLADLNAASVSAEQIIATAVNAGAARTATGLQEIVKALTGETASASFAVGGYTGPGGKYEAAGVVHRGEVVFSQDDIARLGGVRAVEAIRTGEMPGYATGGVVGTVRSQLEAGNITSQHAGQAITELTQVQGTTTSGTAAVLDAGITLVTDTGNVNTWLSSGGAVAVGETIYAKDNLGSFSIADAQAYVRQLADAGNLRGVYDAAILNGISAASLDAMMGWATGTSNGWARGAGLPEFSVGGYTGPGGKYEAAGVVHRGEVVFSQDDIARLGGVRAVEAIRTGEMPGYATGGVVGAPVVVPAPVIPGRVAMAPRPAAATPDPEQQERDAQARDQAQRDAQQQTQDLIAQLRQVNSNLTELKRSVDKNGQANDQMNNKLYNTADTTLKLLRKFDALGMPVVQAATEAA